MGNVKILKYQTAAVASPPMIVIDILRRGVSFKTATIPLTVGHLKDIRVGYHPEKIRVVLDIRGSRIPPFATETNNKGLSIFLRSEVWGARDHPATKKTIFERAETPFKGNENKALRGTQVERASSLDRLIQIVKDDGQEDTALFLKGVHAYRAQNWSTTIDNLDRLLKVRPTGKYAERAQFLIAKAYEKKFSDSLDSHFPEIQDHYTEAVRKFPESEYVAEALLSIADLYYRIDNPYEALGYYKLVLRKEPDSLLSVKAKIGMARIMTLRKERKEAVELLQGIMDKYPESEEIIEAKMEMAKILYEMNHFLKSQEILLGLRKTDPENRYRFPELSLYLGYNDYQLGENKLARANLLRFYNSRPDGELSHLILTKIGDTYREEGALNEASKFYNLVLTSHPETEGAVISRIRLAELKQDGGVSEANAESTSIVNLLGREKGSAREIYEQILDSSFHQDKKKSLEQLTLLRLANLQQNEKDYYKSLETLRKLFEQFPNTPLKNDGEEALKGTLQAILEKEMTAQEYRNVLNTYEREKDLFNMINDPSLFLEVARASVNLKLKSMAVEMFKRADSQWQAKDKPPDLLYFLAEDLLDEDRLRPAMTNADLIIKNYRSDPYVADAYQLKGRIFFKQKQLQKAAEMFSSAADFDVDPCKRTGLLIDKGRALSLGGSTKEAMAALGEANRLRGNCNQRDTLLNREIGELFLNLGYPGEALSIFNQALELEENEASIILLKLKAAECYWLLNKRADSLALFDQIAALEDPFWSNLARERKEEMNFKAEIEDMKRD